jgi:hypothetical protein
LSPFSTKIRQKAARPGIPTADELWHRVFAEANIRRDRFAAIPFEEKGGQWQARYYQDIAIRGRNGAGMTGPAAATRHPQTTGNSVTPRSAKLGRHCTRSGSASRRSGRRDSTAPNTSAASIRASCAPRQK